jgi:hypothetical protein
MDIIEECEHKTKFIKSFQVLKYILEKNKLGQLNLEEVLDKRKIKKEELKKELSKGLTGKEIAKLMKLRLIVPRNAVILFLSYLDYPLVGYNIENVRNLFRHPGWLFHATTAKGLDAIAKSNHILSPMELILENKRFVSKKFSDESIVERLRYGLPFAFQNVSKYQPYIFEEGPFEKQKPGGFFVFPLREVIEEDKILQFGGIDGFPEIDLIDPYQNNFAEFLKRLGDMKGKYEDILNKVDGAAKTFEDCKKHKEEIDEFIERYVESDDLKIEENLKRSTNWIEHQRVFYFMELGIPSLNSLSEMKLTDELIKEELGEEKYERYKEKHGELYKTERGREGSGFRGRNLRRYDKLYRKYANKARAKYYKENSFMYGDSEFFAFIKNYIGDMISLERIKRSVDLEEFFPFLLTYLSLHSPTLIPIHSFYASKEEPRELKGTMFQSGTHSYLTDRKNDEISFIVAQLQKQKGKISPQILQDVRELKAKEVKKLITSTRNEVVKSISKLAQTSRKGSLNKVDIIKGVLFLSLMWYWNFGFNKTLKSLIRRKVAIIAGFEFGMQRAVEDREAYAVIDHVVGAKNLEVLEGFRTDRVSYIYCRGSEKQIYYHFNDKNKEVDLRLN